MSLFFRHRPTAEVNFSVRSVDETTAGDIVLVSRSVWDGLCFSGESRKAVSIKSTRQYSTGLLADHIGALTCWAVYDPTVSEIAIPPTWLTSYPTIFPPSQITLHGSSKSVILSPVEDFTLTEFVLAAKHEEAYVAASVHGAVLENWFFESHVIVRDGEEVSVPSSIFSMPGLSTRISSSYLRYTVSLALPYKQGIAQRGSTAFMVISSDEADEVSDAVNDAPEQENLEISESFLISATLCSPEPLFQANESVKVPGVVFSVETLRSPIDADLDQVTVYVCASSLRPLGILNGDWALASPLDSSSSRLVRISALDAAFSKPRKCSALLSPNLLHNLCPRGALQIVLRVSPYGGRDPGVATAKSITLARVASPFSIHRRYDSLFIDALHEYFVSSQRLVKDGDIIPLRIDVDHSLDPQSVMHSGDFKRAVMHNFSYVSVYFAVRNVDYESFTPQTHGQPLSVPDIGCFVNTSITKIIQVGVEHTEVPDVYGYYELGRVRSASPVATGISRQIVQLSNAMSLDETTCLGARPTVFITGGRGTGKFSAALCIARRLQMHLVEINCFSSLSETVVKTESLLREQVETAIACSPCLVVLRHIDALRHPSTAVNADEGSLLLRTLLEWVDDKTRGKQCILLGIAEHGKQIDDISFSNEIEIKALSEEERFDLLLAQVDSQARLLAPDVSLASLAKQTAALVASDLTSLVQKTCLCAVIDSDQWKLGTQPVMSTKQFSTALLKARSTFAKSMGIPSIPTVFWEDIGGLDSVKSEILDTVQLPLDHPQLFQDGLKKRSGILLYGPPGTGKTLLAKAVATSCSLNFFSVKGPELLNMYIGESEANVRRVFQQARDAKPCVIFFDELDSIAPKRGNQGDSGGVMDRIVSQLLAELDGMSVGGMDVFVIGATNRPDLLDPALLRPGRFDRMLYLGVCETHAAQLDILKALTRKFNLDTNLDLSAIADYCPFNYTGADFYALCADALLHSLSCKVTELEKERAELNALSKYKDHPISPQFFISEMKSNADLQLLVKTEDFEFALAELIPSISISELLHYISIQKNWHH